MKKNVSPANFIKINILPLEFCFDIETIVSLVNFFKFEK